MLQQCLVFALILSGTAVAQQQGSSAAEVWKEQMDRGRALESRGHYSQAQERFQAALNVAGSFPPQDPRIFVTSLALGVAAAAMGQYTEAEQWYNQAIRLGVEIYGKDAALLAVPFTNLATLYRDQKQYARAEEFCRRALRLISEQEPAPPATLARLLGTLGGILVLRGKLPEAEHVLQQSVRIAQKLPLSEILPGLLNNLAGVYLENGRDAEALAALQQAYALYHKINGVNHPHTAGRVRALCGSRPFDRVGYPGG
jgi:tetratricopeptide (TPR) repeat protein